jgi:hypothetical protein
MLLSKLIIVPSPLLHFPPSTIFLEYLGSFRTRRFFRDRCHYLRRNEIFHYSNSNSPRRHPSSTKRFFHRFFPHQFLYASRETCWHNLDGNNDCQNSLFCTSRRPRLNGHGNSNEFDLSGLSFRLFPSSDAFYPSLF